MDKNLNMKRIDFFAERFQGIGFGGTTGYYDETFYFVGTFLCFNMYFELNLGKID